MWLRLRNVGKSKMSVFSFPLRIPDPCLLLRDPGLFINLPRNWFSQSFHHTIFTWTWHFIPQSPCMSRVFKLFWQCILGFVLVPFFSSPRAGDMHHSLWAWKTYPLAPVLILRHDTTVGSSLGEATIQVRPLLCWCCLVAQLCPTLLPPHGL